MDTVVLKELPRDFVLGSGSHGSLAQGGCAMEWVAWLANEEHSDRPRCACPTLAAFARRLNDSRWPTDEDRTDAMRPMLALLVGTRSTRDDERRRADALVHLALSRWAPMALCAAVGAIEARGGDASEMRAAALKLAECPTAENAREARDVARRAAAYAADAYAAYAADAAAYAADAAAYAADAADAAYAAYAAYAADAYAADAYAADAYAAYAADADAYAAYAAYAADARRAMLRIAADDFLALLVTERARVGAVAQ